MSIEKASGIFTYHGYNYKNWEIAELYAQLNQMLRTRWIKKVKGNNKYTPHQGEQEKARRVKNGI